MAVKFSLKVVLSQLQTPRRAANAGAAAPYLSLAADDSLEKGLVAEAHVPALQAQLVMRSQDQLLE